MDEPSDEPLRELPGEPERSERERRHLFERAIPVLLRGLVERAVERGVGRLAEGPDNLRHLVGDIKLPKEVLHYLYSQIDETKNGLYRAVAKEMRDVLEQTQFADEITKVLTRLSFEIKTEIRFVPNDAERGDDDDASAPDGEEATRTGLPRPSVSSKVSVHDRGKEPRRERRRREPT